MIIYLVIGSHGEYSNRSEWPIKAYHDKADAQKLIDKFPGLSEKVYEHYETLNKWYKNQCLQKGVWNNPTIPNWSEVREAIYNEKRRMETEIEEKYLGLYLKPKDPEYPYRSIPYAVNLIEIELE